MFYIFVVSKCFKFMKGKKKLILSVIATIIVSSCGNSGVNEKESNGASGSDYEIFHDVNNDEMVYVKGGTFKMGEVPNQRDGIEVTLDDFYIGKYEVTQGLWEYVMSYSGPVSDGSIISAHPDVWLGPKPSFDFGSGEGESYPIYGVTYNEIVSVFIPRLNNITGKSYRLPTEAEWEYAARGGAQSKGYVYSGSNNVAEVANYYNPYKDNTRTNNNDCKALPVGSKAPNELGIYDMSGNISEWCSNWLGRYSSQPQKNPQGPDKGSDRVIRGGNCYGDAKACMVSYVGANSPETDASGLGFRLAASIQ